MNNVFRRLAERAAAIVGSSGAFLVALSIVIAWLLTGPIFHFSDTWQLIINTGTTIITFLMVFLIQNAQNRDGRVMQLKLDELIRSAQNARNSVIDIEQLSDEQLSELKQAFGRLAEKDVQGVEHLLEEVEEEVDEREEQAEKSTNS